MMSLPTMPERRFSGVELVAMSLTAIAFAVILAYGLSRRAGGAAGGPGGRGEDEEGGVEIVDGRVIDIKSGGQGHGGSGDRSKDASAFPTLADASARELAEVLGDVDPAVAAAIIETRGMSEEAARIFYVIVPQARQLEIGLWLGRARVIARTELGQMETAAGAALARVRSRVTVGGATRLADFLSAAPDDVRSRLLDDVAARDAAMADAARGSMVVFADLEKFSDKSVRRIVTGIDPGIVALALAGAPESLRAVVLMAVSKRLRGIIEGEAEGVVDRPAKDIEAARRILERAMFQLHTRGELVPRAA
jgi:flagellar motor switch protein FliG